MAYIPEYWNNKKERAEQAKKHTEMMGRQCAPGIARCVHMTKTYGTEFTCCSKNIKKDMTVDVIDMDTVLAGKTYAKEGKVALLNFASYKNPGGLFLNGSKAQEECLCHASCLYNVLKEFSDYYKWNNEHKNKGLYLNRALYSPDVLFHYEDTLFGCDVITCAAPNKSTAQEYCQVSDEDNLKALESRIKFILDIAKDNEVDILVLGAYGCGVFGQNPTEVAMLFKKYLETTHSNCFKKVVFAIPNGDNNNLSSFKEVFEKRA